MGPDAGSAEELNKQGNARKAAGDFEAALVCYRLALGIDPAYLPALYNLGLVLHESGRFAEAEAAFQRLLALHPSDVDALFHMGALQQRVGRLAEAARTFQVALDNAPHDAHLWMRLGDVRMGQAVPEALAEAAACYARAATLTPQSFEAHFNRGNACAMLGRHDGAVEALACALRLRPDHPGAIAGLMHQMQQACDWSRFSELSEALLRATAAASAADEEHAEPFLLLSVPSTLNEQLICARAHARSIEARARATAGRAAAARRNGGPVRARDGRLRLGYLSSDFHEHVTAHVMAEVFERHDRRRFECTGYSYGPDDRSPVRRRLEAAFERFVDLSPLSDAEAADRIAASGIDVLVDLKGYTRDARPGIPALRPAPVQASFLGFFATMGAAFIDYIVTDRLVLPPEEARLYSEQPAYLPVCCFPGDRARPRRDPPGRRELGLPENAFVFCCFNQTYKILPEVFAVWMRLLRQLPDAVLWLLEGNKWSSENLRRAAQREGVDPARLVIAPRTAPEQYLRRLAAADLFLDTTPYNAHTTANDALWVGLPVLTCTGATIPSRVAASQLQAIGLPELIAGSLEQYEAIALRLARSPALLSELRARLARNRDTSALFDTERLVRGLEALYEEMWRIHVAGGAPRPIGA